MEYTTSSPEFLHLRKKAEARINQQKEDNVLSKGNRAFIPNVIHSTVSVVRDTKVTQEKMMELFEVLNTQRKELMPVDFKVKEIMATHFLEKNRTFLKSIKIPLNDSAMLSVLSNPLFLDPLSQGLVTSILSIVGIGSVLASFITFFAYNKLVENPFKKKLEKERDKLIKRITSKNLSIPEFNTAEKRIHEIENTLEKDKAMIQMDKTLTSNVGGIDLNEIKVNKEGAGSNIYFSDKAMQTMLDAGINGASLNSISGFAPVIIHLTPMNSIFQILGLEPKNKVEKDIELSYVRAPLGRLLNNTGVSY